MNTMNRPQTRKPDSTKKAKAPSASTLAAQTRQHIVWTALPCGIRGRGGERKLRLSVFVAPRLEATADSIPPTLALFPDFLDWPARIKAAKFTVLFEAGPRLEEVERAGEGPDSKLWKSLFRPTATVESFQFPERPTPILDFPVVNVQEIIRKQYVEVASNPEWAESLPTLGQLARHDSIQMAAIDPHPVQVASLDSRVAIPRNVFAQRSRELTDLLRTRKVIPHRPVIDPEQDLTQARMFHTPAPVELVQIPLPQIDFHKTLSCLGQYPALLRKLGLVVDLEIGWRADIPESGTVAVIPTWGSRAREGDHTPRTQYIHTDRIFLPAPRPEGSDIQSGMLKFSDPSFQVVQVDVDGAAEKSTRFAGSLAAAISVAGSTRESEQVGMPTLRTTGISVVRAGRAERMQNQLQTAVANNSKLASESGDLVLFADDVTRGFRVDVWESRTKAWRSLCRRIGRYRFPGSGVEELEIEDEGFVSSAATEAAASSDDTVRLHQSMFQWTGWSLAAPRPGKIITLDDTAGEVESNPLTASGLRATFRAAPRSLPRLRFGSTYRLRARVVDVAGNSLRHEEPDAGDFSLATAPITYSRFEPVGSPAVVLRKDTKPAPASQSGPKGVKGLQADAFGLPGESVERLVIRSHNDAPAKDATPCGQSSDRHVAPPKTSQLTAEIHGMFDEGGAPRKGAYELIVKRDGSLKEIEPTEQLVIPYLPDPLAVGASLRGLPGAPLKAVRASFYDGAKWPEAKAFRLRLAEGAAAPQWDNGQRVLTVFLPKAETATVLVSSHLPDDKVSSMGVWQWMEEAAGPPSAGAATAGAASTAAGRSLRKLSSLQDSAAQEETQGLTAGQVKPGVFVKAAVPPRILPRMRSLIVDGSHWMFAPYRTITLVHAVLQPLLAPVLQVGCSRGYGQTFALIGGQFTVHGRSTEKVDVMADWSEPIDPVSEDTWKTIAGSARVFEQAVERVDTSVKFSYKRHDFGDTKHRRVRYTALATTRFREYFPSALTGDPKSITRQNDGVTIDVFNSARPAAPQPLYVIPTFGWETQRTRDGITRKRTGGGLRVYLERPWWSSGEGELLGVVIQDETPRVGQPGVEAPDWLKPYVTQWGTDPIWASRPLQPGPRLSDFKGYAEIGKDVSLEEIPSTRDPRGPKVWVVGYPTTFDPQRKLWSADLQIDPGSAYFPFIRLALARFQPKSTPDAHISRVVSTDFAQLTPDRSSSVSFSGKRKVNVGVMGPCYAAGQTGLATEVEVTVELREKNTQGDAGWIPQADFTTKLTSKHLTETVLMWSGVVTLPHDRGSKPCRLVIREYEQLAADERESQGQPAGAFFIAYRRERRLVYADSIEL